MARSTSLPTTRWAIVSPHTDALGRTTSYTFDALNRLVSNTDPRGNITSYEYDANGNRTRVVDASGNVTEFRYDALDRVIEQIDPLSQSTIFNYDAIGNVIGKTDRNGREMTYVYDGLDRMTAENWLDATGQVVKQFTYAFDPVDNLLTASDANVTHSYTYDALNRMIQSQDTASRGGGLTLSMSYDAVGNRVSVSDENLVTVAATFDPRNLVESLRWQGGGTAPARVDFAYDARGERTLATRFADLAGQNKIGSTAWGRDLKGRLVAVDHRDAVDAVFSGFDYQYDLADQLIRETTGGDQIDYGYDASGQLTSADAINRADESYAYDANGNRLSATNTVGAGNRLLADAVFDYAYDPEGNLTSKTDRASGTVTDFVYDYRNRLTDVTVTAADGTLLMEAEYVYDVFDRRIVTSVDEDGSGPQAAEEMHTVYDGQHAWADLLPDGSVDTRYLFGAGTDEILARWRPGEGTAWYLADRLGSITHLVDDAGTVLSTNSYGSFGNVLSETNPQWGDRFKYTGREYDTETGNYYYRARYYDATTGRFLSEDSYGFRAGDTNLYRYGFNRPTAGTDPSGHVFIVQHILGGMAGSAIGGLGGYVAGAWCDYWTQWADLYAQARQAQSSCGGNPQSGQIDWDQVHQAGLDSATAGAAFGFIFGFSFSALPMPLGLTLGVGVGLPVAVMSLMDTNQKIDDAWDNREAEPERLLAVSMCLFGDASVGAVQGLAGAAASKAIRRIDSDKLVDDVVRFMVEEDGSVPLNNESWRFRNSQAKKVDEAFGVAAARPASRLTSLEAEALAKAQAFKSAARLRDAARTTGTDPPKKASAVVDARTGRTYHGIPRGNKAAKQPTNIHPELAKRMPTKSLETWRVTNCAEFNAVNNALHDGATWTDLRVYTVDVARNVPVPRCQNCTISLDGIIVPSL